MISQTDAASEMLSCVVYLFAVALQFYLLMELKKLTQTSTTMVLYKQEFH